MTAHGENLRDLRLRFRLTVAAKDIAKAHTHNRRAAEHLQAATELGVSEREIAGTVGSSVAWVSTLLAWRAAGYPTPTPTAFYLQSAASCAKDAAVQALKCNVSVNKDKVFSTDLFGPIPKFLRRNSTDLYQRAVRKWAQSEISTVLLRLDRPDRTRFVSEHVIPLIESGTTSIMSDHSGSA